MTKPRLPGTPQFAVHRICQRLGVKAAARACGAAPRTLYKWSDPDERSTPPIAQALALDRAFAAAGGGALPLFELYQAAVADCRTDPEACAIALGEDLAETAREFGEAVESALRATRPGVSPRDLMTAMAETEDLRSASDSMLRRLGAMFRRGAGPRPVVGESR